MSKREPLLIDVPQTSECTYMEYSSSYKSSFSAIQVPANYTSTMILSDDVIGYISQFLTYRDKISWMCSCKQVCQVLSSYEPYYKMNELDAFLYFAFKGDVIEATRIYQRLKHKLSPGKLQSLVTDGYLSALKGGQVDTFEVISSLAAHAIPEGYCLQMAKYITPKIIKTFSTMIETNCLYDKDSMISICSKNKCLALWVESEEVMNVCALQFSCIDHISLHIGWDTSSNLSKISSGLCLGEVTDEIVKKWLMSCIESDSAEGVKWIKRNILHSSQHTLWLPTLIKALNSKSQNVSVYIGGFVKLPKHVQYWTHSFQKYIKCLAAQNNISSLKDLAVNSKLERLKIVWTCAVKHLWKDAIIYMLKDFQDLTLDKQLNTDEIILFYKYAYNNMYSLQDVIDDFELTESWCRIMFYRFDSTNLKLLHRGNFGVIPWQRSKQWKANLDDKRLDTILKKDIVSWLEMTRRIEKCLMILHMPIIVTSRSLMNFCIFYNVSILDNYPRIFTRENVLYMIKKCAKNLRVKYGQRLVSVLSRLFQDGTFEYVAE